MCKINLLLLAFKIKIIIKMKIKSVLGLSVVTLFLATSCNKVETGNKPLKTALDSLSYSLGLDVADKVNSSVKEIDSDIFVQGYRTGLDSSKTSLIDQEKASAIIRSYFENKGKEDEAKREEEAYQSAKMKFQKNKAAGELFLSENISKKGVQTTESGLQYLVLKEGKGEKPVASSTVKVHYHGTLVDGTVFDSSVDRKEPATFGVGQVIQGWIEGLQLMPVGSKYKFFIPHDLGYGYREQGQIKPFSTLIFEVELLEIVKK